MGGLIGLGLAALARLAGAARWCSTTSGPTIQAGAIARIGAYLGQPRPLATASTRRPTRCWAISPGFGPHTPRAVAGADASRMTARRDGDGFVPHYDPAIAVPFRAVTPESAAAGEAVLWQAYDRVRCPTLLLRGAESDLLSRDTAQAMTQRGPRARLVEFAGVGHAPTLVAAGPDRARCASSCSSP